MFLFHFKKPPRLAAVMFCGLCLNFLGECDQENSKFFFVRLFSKEGYARCISTHILRRWLLSAFKNKIVIAL
jgi:hypothetical protein